MNKDLTKTKEGIFWKRILLDSYLSYISFYYLTTRLLFLLIGIFTHYDLLLLVREFIFPLLYSIICLITVVFIELYINNIKKIETDENLKEDLFSSFPNKYILSLVFIIGIILNLEGLMITKRLNIYQYKEFIGIFLSYFCPKISKYTYEKYSIMFNLVEIWQNIFLLPYVFSVFCSIVLTPRKLRKEKEKIKNRKKVYNLFQPFSAYSVLIFFIFFVIYMFLRIKNLTSEGLLLSDLIIIGYFFSVVVSIFIIIQYLILPSYPKAKVTVKNDEDRCQILSKIEIFCSRKNWEELYDLIKLDFDAENFFRKLSEEDIKHQILRAYYERNKKNPKISILLYIAGFYIIKKQECTTKEIKEDLKNNFKIFNRNKEISESAFYRYIDTLTEEGLIKKNKIKEKKKGREVWRFKPNFCLKQTD